MYYVTAYYDISYYIYHRRKGHFEENVDSYKAINEVIICIDIMHFSFIFIKHTFQLLSYNIRYLYLFLYQQELWLTEFYFL